LSCSKHTKHFSRTTTHFLWSGNVPLHEWKETFEFNYSTGLYDLGTEHSPTTWIFEAGSFVPCGKISNGKHYSIITDHLGTLIEAYNQEGELIWEREQDLYGNSRQGFAKENFRCPFKYQGQYYDSEVELCYNRFRYYHPEIGRYVSEDPIKLLGGFNIFAYVSDTNAWVDLLGLNSKVYGEKDGKKLEDDIENLLIENNIPYIRGEKFGENASIGEIDFRANNIIIEVTVRKNGKAPQIKRLINDKRINPNDDPVILFAPNYKDTPAKDIDKQGAFVIRDSDELIEIIK